MKNHLFILCLLPLSVQAIERDQLDKMLTAAVTAQSNAYIEARATITNLGTNALPMLAQAGNDATLSWQQRLVARIGYERIQRADAIDALCHHDWRAYPPYSAPHAKMIFLTNEVGKIVSSEVQPPGARFTSVLGPQTDMGQYVIPKCREAGLWYYFIELTWKQTGENGVLKPRDPRFEQVWPKWCREAMIGQPEACYLPLVKAERVKNDPALDDPQNMQFYRELLKTEDGDTVSTLVQRYNAYNRRKVIGPEMYAGEDAKIYANEFRSILAFADSRHVDLLDKFIADHAALADLKSRLADVRAKPAPAAKADPPFRTGGLRDVTQTNK
jgi:hypothetical protein